MVAMRSFFLFLSLCISAKSFEITPIRFDQRIDGRQGYREYQVVNSGSSVVRYKVSVMPGPEGKPSMYKWAEVSPRVLTIKPGKIGIVKLFTRAPENISEGEYFFFLNLKSIPIPKLEEEQQEKLDTDARFGLDMSIGLSGYAGNLEPLLKIEEHCFRKEEENTFLDLTIASHTEKRGVSYRIEIIRTDRSVLTVDRGRIRPMGRDMMTLDLGEISEQQVARIWLVENESGRRIDVVKKEAGSV